MKAAQHIDNNKNKINRTYKDEIAEQKINV